MLKNYFVVALRSLRRRKGYAFINLLGLALGLACCLLIGLYVRHELSYDQHHADAERVYRVVQHTSADGSEGMAWVGGAMGNALREDFPQIESLARLVRENVLVELRDGPEPRSFEEPRFVYADPAVFDVLTLPFVQGDAAALDTPDTVLLTETTAEKYFGEAEPVGRTIYVADRALTVGGVLEDPPATSHLPFGLMTSLDTFKLEQWGSAESAFTSYWWPNTYTYVKLRADASAEAVAAELPAFIARHREPGEAARFVPALQPLTRHPPPLRPRQRVASRRRRGDRRRLHAHRALRAPAGVRQLHEPRHGAGDGARQRGRRAEDGRRAARAARRRSSSASRSC